MKSKIMTISGIAIALGLLGVANNMVTEFQDYMSLFSYFDAEVDFSVKSNPTSIGVVSGKSIDFLKRPNIC